MMPTPSEFGARILSYADPRADHGRWPMVRWLSPAGACMTVLSFLVGSCGGFFGNPGFPDDVRLLGALGVLIGSIVYVAGRILRDKSQSLSTRWMSVAVTTISLVCVAFVVPFRTPSVFVSHPFEAWSLRGAEAIVRYRLTDDSVFALSATILLTGAGAAIASWVMTRAIDRRREALKSRMT